MSGTLITVWLCAAVAAAVFAAMMISIATFGRPSGDCPAPGSGKAAEILWALIPIVIALAAATPALRTTVFAGSGVAAHSGSQSGVALIHRPPPLPPAAVTHGP